MNISPERLKGLRKERGWSQEKLAVISGVSERTIQRAEKDGSCSLDTKLALSTALEISPAELSQPIETVSTSDKPEYTVDWGGAFGLFVLGLVMMAVVLFTGTNGKWEVASMSIVWGLTAVVSIVSIGARDTYRLYDSTSWIVKYPNRVRGLNVLIAHAKLIISYSYIIGVSASIITSVSLAVYSNLLQDDFQYYFAITAKPIIYAIIFCELWFQPFKRKMERMLQQQSE